MSNLQQILLTLSSILSQTLVSQMALWNILTKEAQGITPETRETFMKLGAQDMEGLKLLGEISRLIAHID
jgi:hypothetical protein